jgi:hypothetical protein
VLAAVVLDATVSKVFVLGLVVAAVVESVLVVAAVAPLLSLVEEVSLAGGRGLRLGFSSTSLSTSPSLRSESGKT